MAKLGTIAGLILSMISLCAGQISPGELSFSHRNLEGMEHCTSCHTIGKALSNDNCLHCHQEIQSRQTADRGYHASIKKKECVECHKEHHGREFSIIRFDKEKFDHAQSGFALEGKHAALQCEKCHTKEKIVDKDAASFSDQRKTKTYLGLSIQCQSCHADQHRGQFKQACIQCHTLNGWKPASKFNHDEARFQLVGAHTTVECGQCHKRTWDNNSTIAYTGLEFGLCSSCHADPHRGNFKQPCSQCHTTDSWHRVRSTGFDHNQTRFPLRGKHALVKCETCHPKNTKARNVSGGIGFHITKFQRCKDCHEDAHAKQFDKRKDGGACENCHTDEGFVPSKFSMVDHINTRFSLTGAHKAVPCSECHHNGRIHAKSTKQFHWEGDISCETCHNDIHNGQFKRKGTKNCEVCHNTGEWKDLKFSHDKTDFPLKGKHSETPCEKCHKTVNTVVQFVGLTKNCYDCHEDKHAGQFEKGGITHCERCHSEKGWKVLLFDHNTQSQFRLTGKHETVPCAQCHKESVINKQQTTLYKPIESACINCHPAQ